MLNGEFYDDSLLHLLLSPPASILEQDMLFSAKNCRYASRGERGLTM